MRTVAIIAEYNPFHNGHSYQIKKIREEFGNDTAIIAIMSGNYTQRGEVAITDKLTRATTACLGGVNLVLELPFPFSMSSADYFARSAVKIINDLGFVDYLSFGSEVGDIDLLHNIANAMLSDAYRAAIANYNDKTTGFAKASELALRSISPDIDFKFTPNNILALEYIKALIVSKSKVKPHTIKRLGQAYLDKSNSNESLPSAMSIRELLHNDYNIDDIIKSLPATSHDTIKNALSAGDMPACDDKLSYALLSYFRINTSLPDDIIGVKEGLYNRLCAAAYEANNISTMLKLSETKKYTNAKIRRVMWYAFFGVTSSELNSLPSYTQLLALDTVGMSLLHSYGDISKISILTKPTRLDMLNDVARSQKALGDKADSVYELFKPIPKSGKTPLTLTPFIKK